jgi:hypothetical protein
VAALMLFRNSIKPPSNNVGEGLTKMLKGIRRHLRRMHPFQRPCDVAATGSSAHFASWKNTLILFHRWR